MRIVNIDADRPRKMRIKFEYLDDVIKMAEKYGLTTGDKIEMTYSTKMIIDLFHIALKHDDPNITREQTSDIVDLLMDKHGFNYIVEKVNELMKMIGIEVDQKGLQQKAAATW